MCTAKQEAAAFHKTTRTGLLRIWNVRKSIPHGCRFRHSHRCHDAHEIRTVHTVADPTADGLYSAFFRNPFK